MNVIAILFVGLALASPTKIQSEQDASHPVEGLALDTHIDWVDDGAIFLDGRRAKRSLTDDEGATDRVAILDSAIARAKQDGKLVLWYVPRIIEESSKGRQMYRAPILDGYMRQVVFCDEYVSELIDRRFVPVRMVCDQALSDRYELRPLEFVEPAVVFLNGEGELVHFVERIRTFDGLWFAHVMRRVLAQVGLDDGRVAVADESTIEGCLARAEAFRRDIEPKQAHAALDAAQAIHDAVELVDDEGKPLSRRDERVREHRKRQGDIDLLRGKLWMMEGDLLLAEEPLEEAYQQGVAEAGYLHALLTLRLGDEASAMRRFAAVAQRFPESLVGRRAAANVTIGPDERPIGAAFSGFEHYAFLPKAAYSGALPRDTTWAGEKLSPRAMAIRGVQFLLSQQRDDGGFTDARYAYWPSTEITPNTWIAITALACTALLEFRDYAPEEIDRAEIDLALARGEAFLFDPKRINRGENEELYADAYRLLYLTRRAKHVPESRSLAIDRMNEIVTAAAEHQSEDGFFAHEYRNAFCTGVMLWNLELASDSGANVPGEMIRKGVEALWSARHEEGTYAYGGTADKRGSTLKDSAGRMPMCEAILVKEGKSNLANLDFALDNFWEHFQRIERVRRNDFHSDGELAGFFFFHDFFQTSELIEMLPERKDETRAKFFKILQAIPEIDGSFLDSHEFGRSYATAMALLTLRNVAEL